MENIKTLETRQIVHATLEIDFDSLDELMTKHNIPREKIDKLKEHWAREFDDFEVKVKWFLADWVAEDIIKTIQGEEPWEKKKESI